MQTQYMKSNLVALTQAQLQNLSIRHRSSYPSLTRFHSRLVLWQWPMEAWRGLRQMCLLCQRLSPLNPKTSSTSFLGTDIFA